MASKPKMECQLFLCIFQKNSAMATLGLKEMGKRSAQRNFPISFGKCKEKPGTYSILGLDAIPLSLKYLLIAAHKA